MSEFLDLSVDVDAAAAIIGLREARRDVNSRTKEGLRIAGERAAVPAAKALAPVRSGRLRSSIIARATSRKGYLTTSLRGKNASIVAIQELGAKVEAPIKPKNAKALHFGNRYVAKVTTPRRYKGHHFMELGIRRARPQIERAVTEEIMRAFDGINGG